MDIFYTIVLTIATVLLILLLTYIGLTINNKKKTSIQTFPPNSATCPDYWDISPTDSSLCLIPKLGYKNTGDIYDSTGAVTIKPSTSFGYESSNKTMNFNDAKWDTTGVTSICAKKKWANNRGIIWDGVSNNNSC
jgi:hypothetical protein